MFDPQFASMRRLFAVLVVFGAGAVMSCAPSVEQRGNLPNPDKIAEIHAGSTTKDEVAKILGTPSSVSVFNNDKSWYYISRRTAQTAFFEPDVLDQPAPHERTQRRRERTVVADPRLDLALLPLTLVG